MPELEVTFEEAYGESRSIEITNNGISQTIVCRIKGNFYEVAEQNEAGLYNDDIFVMQTAYQVLPLFYQLPNYQNSLETLIIQSIKLDQESDTVWKITAQYSIPADGGKKGGGLGEDDKDLLGIQGPDYGENDGNGWSENFTQISVNMSVGTRKQTFSNQVIACQRSVNIGPGGIPYTAGAPAPIGHTNDGIEGAEVYDREFGFSITAYFPPEKLKYAYVRRLARMQTTLNTGIFFGFAVGSVMFMEASFSGDLYQVVPVTFDFKQKNNFYFSQTLSTVLADPEIEGGYDRYYEPDFEDSAILSGWVDVDYRYAPVPDTDAVMVIQRPVLRVVHLNYEYSDFGKLEI